MTLEAFCDEVATSAEAGAPPLAVRAGAGAAAPPEDLLPEPTEDLLPEPPEDREELEEPEP